MPRKAVTSAKTKLAPINFRTTQERRTQLEKRAEASGRSLAQEVERLLDFAMNFEDELGGPDLLFAIKLIAQTAGQVQQAAGKGIDDYYTRIRVASAIHAATGWALPLSALRISNEPLVLGIIEIHSAMSIVASNVDLDSLWYLAQGHPLHEEQFEEFKSVLKHVRVRFPGQPEWGHLEARLEEAQAAAIELQKKVEDEGHEGRKTAQAAFSYAVHNYKRQAYNYAWHWTRRSRVRLDPKRKLKSRGASPKGTESAAKN